jgi:hypothetical protein
VSRVLDEYALANDVGLQIDDVPVGSGEMLPFLSALHRNTGSVPSISPPNQYVAQCSSPVQCLRGGLTASD